MFYESRNDRQAAAVHYQLGSFYSSYWPLYPSRSDGLLEKALLHYREAHSYYSKYDVGPTLLLILVDMCDLYLSAYSATEPFLKSVKKVGEPDRIADSTVFASPQGPGSQRLSTADESATERLEDKKRLNGSDEDASGSMVGPDSWSQSELVVALLGGALQSLLESRFAFTPAVAVRSRYRSQILSLAADVAKRLSSVLIKVLRAYSKGLLPSPDNLSSDKISSSTFLGEIEPKSIKELRLVTPTTSPAPALTFDEFNGATAAAICTSDPNDMVTEARMICTELLRWSAVPVVPSATSEVENKSTASGGNGSVISSTPPYTLSGAEGTVSVHRLYELINMINQNAWLRRCATSSK